jgi:streptogramin lyase
VTDFLTELREELLDGLDRYERAPRRRPRLGLATVARPAAIAAAVTALAFGAAQVVQRAPDREQSVRPELSRLEGFHATSAVATADSLWVSQYDISSLLRIDPRTGAVRARIDVGGSPGTVIAGAGAVWVFDWDRGRIVKVDPRTNRVVKTLGGRRVPQ